MKCVTLSGWHYFNARGICQLCGAEYLDTKAEDNEAADMVNAPPHYNQAGIECIDAIAAATINKTGVEAFNVGNVIKYLWRYESKNGIEDVKKARKYLDMLIGELEK